VKERGGSISNAVMGELGRRQPGEPAAIVNPTKGHTPVAIKTVPTKLGCPESLAAHGLHRVPEERLDLTNLDSHVLSRPPAILPFGGGRTRGRSDGRARPLQRLVGRRRRFRALVRASFLVGTSSSVHQTPA